MVLLVLSILVSINFFFRKLGCKSKNLYLMGHINIGGFLVVLILFIRKTEYLPYSKDYPLDFRDN